MPEPCWIQWWTLRKLLLSGASDSQPVIIASSFHQHCDMGSSMHSHCCCLGKAKGYSCLPHSHALLKMLPGATVINSAFNIPYAAQLQELCARMPALQILKVMLTFARQSDV